MKYTTEKHGTEDEALVVLVRCFAVEMLTKLDKKAKEGFSGWDDPDTISDGMLLESLKRHLRRGNYVDVANLAAFLWNRQESTK